MWRVLAVAVCLVLSSLSSVRAEDPPGYEVAKRAFEALDLENRMQIEILLLAAGYGPVNIGDIFSRHLFDAISKLQAGSGRRTTGIVDVRDVDQMMELAVPALAKWDLRAVTIPDTKRGVLIPSGMGLDPKSTSAGWLYSDNKRSAQIRILPPGRKSLNHYYSSILKSISKLKKDSSIIDKKFYDKLFYILAKEKSRSINYWGILDADDVVIMSFAYDAIDNDFFGKRLENLMVASLWAFLPRGTSLSPPTEASMRRLKEQVSRAGANQRKPPDQTADPPGYAEARRAFEALDVENRRQIQVLLLAAGYGPLDIEDIFSRRLFKAITKMQAGSSQPATGVIGPDNVAQLMALAAPAMSAWGFKTVTIPGSKLGMFVPFGLDLTVDPTPEGWEYNSTKRGLRVEYFRSPTVGIKDAYSEALKYLSSLEGVGIIANHVDQDSFTLWGRRGSSAIDYWGAVDGSGIVFVTFAFDVTNNDFFGLRLEDLMMASLWSELAGRTDLLPTEAALQRLKDEVSPKAPPAIVQAPPAVVQATAPPASDAPSVAGAGTGFFVTAEGMS